MGDKNKNKKQIINLWNDQMAKFRSIWVYIINESSKQHKLMNQIKIDVKDTQIYN